MKRRGFLQNFSTLLVLAVPFLSRASAITSKQKTAQLHLPLSSKRDMLKQLLLIDKVDSRKPYFDLTMTISVGCFLKALQIEHVSAQELIEQNRSIIDNLYYEMVEKELDIYARYYTADEVAALVEFSRATVGIKGNNLIEQNHEIAVAWENVIEGTMEALKASVIKVNVSPKT